MDQPLVSSPEDIGGDDELALVQSDDEEIDEYGAEDGADDVDERAMSPRKERLKDAKGSPIKTAPAPKKTATKKATNSKKKTKVCSSPVAFLSAENFTNAIAARGQRKFTQTKGREQ